MIGILIPVGGTIFWLLVAFWLVDLWSDVRRMMQEVRRERELHRQKKPPTDDDRLWALYNQLSWDRQEIERDNERRRLGIPRWRISCVRAGWFRTTLRATRWDKTRPAE
jgi:hypothetical protein